MSFFDSFFKSKKNTVTQEPMQEAFQTDTGKQLASWVQQYLANYAPGQAYGGDFTAPMTGLEQSGQDQLSKLLATDPTGDLFKAGKTQILDTLGGKYLDPNTNPFIQAMTTLSARNTEDQITSARRSAGSRGTYFKRSGIDAEGDIRGNAIDNLNAIIGQTLESERARQYGAAPTAAGLDEYENSAAPLSRINAASTFGSLARTIAQGDMERRYNDFARQRSETSQLPGIAQDLYGTKVDYGVKSVTTKSPSTFMSMMGEVNPAIGSYNQHQYGYDRNQTSISEAMKALAKIFASGGAG